MFKYLIFIVGFAGLASAILPSKYFTGKVVYKYQFKDANGNDITDAMAKVIGKEQHYFVNDKNYKAYDEANNLLQLYNSDSNFYYQIAKDKSAQKIDASISTSKVFTVKKLKTKEKVAGYVCSTVEVITDDATSTYYYTPLIRINPLVYQKHQHGEWNKIMNATNGFLPLKFKIINHKQGFITWVSSASLVQSKQLFDSDFNLPPDIQIQ